MFIFLSYSKNYIFGRPGLGRSTPNQEAISQIPALLWELIFGRSSVGKSTLPLKCHFHRFLLWLLIFLSYSESSTFGRPGLGTSIPLSNGNFIDSCCDCSYFFPTLRTHIWQTKWWQIDPPSNGYFTDSLSTLRALIWQTMLWQILPLEMAISHIPALTAHISFLLWELNIWQARSWHIYPSFKWQFHRFLLFPESSYLADHVVANLTPWNGNFTDSCSDCSYFFPTLRAQNLADLVWADLSPLKWQFHRFLLYPESSYLADQVLEELPPFQKAISQIHALF